MGVNKLLLIFLLLLIIVLLLENLDKQNFFFYHLFHIYLITKDNAYKYICTLKFISLYIPIIILKPVMFIIFLDVLSLKNMKKV